MIDVVHVMVNAAVDVSGSDTNEKRHADGTTENDPVPVPPRCECSGAGKRGNETMA